MGGFRDVMGTPRDLGCIWSMGDTKKSPSFIRQFLIGKKCETHFSFPYQIQAKNVCTIFDYLFFS